MPSFFHLAVFLFLFILFFISDNVNIIDQGGMNHVSLDHDTNQHMRGSGLGADSERHIHQGGTAFSIGLLKSWGQ